MEAKEILREQLELLTERSKREDCSTKELCELTQMILAVLDAVPFS